MTPENESGPGNRRSSRRKGLRRACVLRLAAGDERPGVTIDLGVDGLCLLSAKPVASGTRCQVSFGLPQGTTELAFSAAIKTLYSSYSGAEGFRIGAVFVALDDSAAAALRSFADSGY